MVAIFFKHFDLLEPYDSPIFSDFSEFGVGRSSCVVSLLYQSADTFMFL